MSIVPQTPPLAHGDYWLPLEVRPNIDDLIIEDGKPLDGMYAERQMRLLTEPLHSSWPGPGDDRPFLALANVGMFYAVKEPPLVPDVMLSLDVVPGDLNQKEHNSYFFWVMGKPPDGVIEIVSNREGNELTTKLKAYARLGIPHYVVWDPLHYLGKKSLQCFGNASGAFKPCEPWFPHLNLGVQIWQGTYEGFDAKWLRWIDVDRNLIPTGEERAEQERQRADSQTRRVRQEKKKAEQERKRADALAAKLRALGVDPDEV